MGEIKCGKKMTTKSCPNLKVGKHLLSGYFLAKSPGDGRGQVVCLIQLLREWQGDPGVQDELE